MVDSEVAVKTPVEGSKAQNDRVDRGVRKRKVWMVRTIGGSPVLVPSSARGRVRALGPVAAASRLLKARSASGKSGK